MSSLAGTTDQLRSVSKGKRLVLYTVVLLSFGAFRMILAGIDPAQDLQNSRASFVLYVADFACLAWALTICANRPNAFLRVARASWPLLVLPVISFASTVVSVSPATTLFEASKYAVAFLVPLAAIVLWYENEETLLSYQLLKVIALLSLFFVVFVPTYGTHNATDFSQWSHAGSWRGIFGHRTSLGYCAAVLTALSFTVLLQSRRRIDMVWLIVSLTILTGANSGGAFAVAGLACLIIFLAAMIARFSPFLKLATLFLLVPASIVVFAAVLPAELLALINKDISFTGRVPLWAYIRENTPINYIVGLGYFSGFNDVVRPLTVLGGFNPPNGQGAYIDALIAFGLIGPILLLLLTGYYLALAIGAYMRSSGRIGRARLCFSVVALVLLAVNLPVESYILEPYQMLVGILLILNYELRIRSQ